MSKSLECLEKRTVLANTGNKCKYKYCVSSMSAFAQHVIFMKRRREKSLARRRCRVTLKTALYLILKGNLATMVTSSSIIEFLHRTRFVQKLKMLQKLEI